MNTDDFIVWAVVLAGGLGSLSGVLGQQIPKVFLPVGLDPVINTPVLRCNECTDIEMIFILTRKGYPEIPDDETLKNWVDEWKKRDIEKRTDFKPTHIVYEEDIG